MLTQHAGQQFLATVSWNWFQSDKKNIWTMTGSPEELAAGTGQLMEVEGVQPAERISYYQSQVQKGADGKFPTQLVVAQAIAGNTYNVYVRANAQLERFGAAPAAVAAPAAAG